MALPNDLAVATVADGPFLGRITGEPLKGYFAHLSSEPQRHQPSGSVLAPEEGRLQLDTAGMLSGSVTANVDAQFQGGGYTTFTPHLTLADGKTPFQAKPFNVVLVEGHGPYRLSDYMPEFRDVTAPTQVLPGVTYTEDADSVTFTGLAGTEDTDSFTLQV